MRGVIVQIERTRKKAVKGLRRIAKLQGEAIDTLDELNRLTNLIRDTKATLTDLSNADTSNLSSLE